MSEADQKSTNAVGTRERILRAATTEFSRGGYSGARMEKIAGLAQCNIRMIYHYFNSKENLYGAVIERSYTDIRRKEEELRISEMEPVEGILELLLFTFDHFYGNPEFISLLTNENLLKGKHVLRDKNISLMTSHLKDSLEKLVDRGVAEGKLSRCTDVVQLYATVAALSWFHLSNAYTLSAMFGKDLTSHQWVMQRRGHVIQVLKAFLELSSQID